MAVLELIINQSLFGQLVVNRFHYIGSGTPAAVTPSFGLVSATGFLSTAIITGGFRTGSFAEYWQNRVSNQLTFVSAYCRNLYEPTDFYESPYPAGVTGKQTGEALSPAMAFGFKSARVRTDIRRGMKRIAGVTEGQVGAGGVFVGDTPAELSTFATKIAATVTYDDEGNTLTYVPCTLGFVEYETPRGNKAYKPYSTESLQLQHVAAGAPWQAFTQVRTQVSRQYGRGS